MQVSFYETFSPHYDPDLRLFVQLSLLREKKNPTKAENHSENAINEIKDSVSLLDQVFFFFSQTKRLFKAASKFCFTNKKSPTTKNQGKEGEKGEKEEGRETVSSSISFLFFFDLVVRILFQNKLNSFLR